MPQWTTGQNEGESGVLSRSKGATMASGAILLRSSNKRGGLAVGLNPPVNPHALCDVPTKKTLCGHRPIQPDAEPEVRPHAPGFGASLMPCKPSSPS